MSRKTEAVKLRTDGHTYDEISDQLGGVAKSTLSSWLAHVPVSTTGVTRLKRRKADQRAHWGLAGADAVARNARERRRTLLEEAQVKVDGLRLTVGGASLVGAALYWAEGSKGRHELKFTNSDLDMLLLMRRWFTEILGVSVSNIRCAVHVYLNNGLTYDDVERYWSRSLDIPRSQFCKPQLNKAPATSKHRLPRRLLYGTLAMRALRPQQYRARYFALLEKLGVEPSFFINHG